MRVSTVRLGAGLLVVSLLCAGLVITGITCDGRGCNDPEEYNNPSNFGVDLTGFTLTWDGYCGNKCATGLGPILMGLMTLLGGGLSVGVGVSGRRSHIKL